MRICSNKVFKFRILAAARYSNLPLFSRSSQHSYLCCATQTIVFLLRSAELSGVFLVRVGEGGWRVALSVVEGRSSEDRIHPEGWAPYSIFDIDVSV